MCSSDLFPSHDNRTGSEGGKILKLEVGEEVTARVHGFSIIEKLAQAAADKAKKNTRFVNLLRGENGDNTEANWVNLSTGEDTVFGKQMKSEFGIENTAVEGGFVLKTEYKNALVRIGKIARTSDKGSTYYEMGLEILEQPNKKV